MRAHEILEYKTRSGDEIEFKYVEDSEGDENRGWIVHVINAYVKGEHAGYIAIAYIPKERFKNHYPTILNYMSNIGGSSILPLGKYSTNPKDLSDEEIKDTVKSLVYHSRKNEYHDMWKSGKEMPETREELLDIIFDITENELKDEKVQFKKFKHYQVDKPYVDFIRVFKQNETRFTRRTKDAPETRSDQDYQRQGIGTALYLEAGEYLKGKGLKLHASSTQQPEAEAAWAKFEKEGRVGTAGKRRYLKV